MYFWGEGECDLWGWVPNKRSGSLKVWSDKISTLVFKCWLTEFIRGGRKELRSESTTLCIATTTTNARPASSTSLLPPLKGQDGISGFFVSRLQPRTRPLPWTTILSQRCPAMRGTVWLERQARGGPEPTRVWLFFWGVSKCLRDTIRLSASCSPLSFIIIIIQITTVAPTPTAT